MELDEKLTRLTGLFRGQQLTLPRMAAPFLDDPLVGAALDRVRMRLPHTHTATDTGVDALLESTIRLFESCRAAIGIDAAAPEIRLPLAGFDEVLVPSFLAGSLTPSGRDVIAAFRVPRLCAARTVAAAWSEVVAVLRYRLQDFDERIARHRVFLDAARLLVPHMTAGLNQLIADDRHLIFELFEPRRRCSGLLICVRPDGDGTWVSALPPSSEAIPDIFHFAPITVEVTVNGAVERPIALLSESA